MGTLDQLRVGIVGCGYQGGILVKAALKTPALRVVACADPDREAARKLAADSGEATSHSSIEEMLAGAEVDIVFVATPHHLLCETALTAIRAGKPTLIEKPVGVIEAEAARIEKAAAEAGVFVEAGYSFRDLPAWRRAYELVRADTVGSILTITGSFTIPPMLNGWKAGPETGGGPLLYVGSHLIDQILWLVADTPVEVYASVTRRADTKADEISAFQIRFANSASAQYVVAQTTPALDYRLNILGRDGRITLNTVGFLDQEIVVQSSRVAEYAQPTTIHPALADDPRMVKHVAQLTRLTGAIRNGGQPFVALSTARMVLKVTDAVFRSGASGRPERIG